MRIDKVAPGTVFGRLTVVCRLPRETGKHRYIYRVKCQCVCGGESTPEISSLTGGMATSCGCRKRECGGESAKIGAAKRGTGYARLIEGGRFGRLTVIKRIADRITETDKRRAVVLCKCDCGKVVEILADSVICGNVRSCGCLSSETTTKRNKETAKFGSFSTKHPVTFSRWASMNARCYREKQEAYAAYGARGVVVCGFLRSSPVNLAKAIGVCKKATPSLDRYPIHNGNYTCGQCDECKKRGWEKNIRWATRKDQSNNRGDFNILLTAFGKTLTRSQWQDLSGINEWRIHKRIKELGWTVEKALTTPDRRGHCYVPE